MTRTLPLIGIAFVALCGTLMAADGSDTNPAELGRTLGTVFGAIVGFYVLTKTIG